MSQIWKAESFVFGGWDLRFKNVYEGALTHKVLSTEVLFFGLEWVAVDDEKAEAILADPAVARQHHFLASSRRYRPHLLSEPEETLMAEKAMTSRSS